jgi:hypothetical protein
VRDAHDAPVEDGAVVDLGEQDVSGAYRRSIRSTEDPIALGVHVPAYLAEDTP